MENKECKLDIKILKCCYLKFKNNKTKLNIKEQVIRESKDLTTLKQYKLMSCFHTTFIKTILQKKKQYIYFYTHNLNVMHRTSSEFGNIWTVPHIW